MMGQKGASFLAPCRGWTVPNGSVPQSFKVSGAASVGIFLLGLGKVIEDTGCVKM